MAKGFTSFTESPWSCDSGREKDFRTKLWTSEELKRSRLKSFQKDDAPRPLPHCRVRMDLNTVGVLGWTVPPCRLPTPQQPPELNQHSPRAIVPGHRGREEVQHQVLGQSPPSLGLRCPKDGDILHESVQEGVHTID